MPRNKINILSIDGGGIRGIIPATVLVHIEKRIREIKGDDKRIADYVDMVAGTSTGAILGAMLLVPGENGRPKFTAEEALEFYVKYGEEIFNQSKIRGMLGQIVFGAAKYSEKRLESLLIEKLGDCMMSDLLKPCIITSYNMYNGSAVFFNSREKKADKETYFLRDVLRSTSAAPTYFNPAFLGFHTGRKADRMVNLDGGVFANNPAMCAYAEARSTIFPLWSDDKSSGKVFPTARNMNMLSLGTGGGYPDLGKTTNAAKWKLLDWARKTPDIMMDGALNTVNYQVQKLYESLEGDEIKNYKRVDYPKPAHIERPPYSSDMSDASPENILILKECGKRTVQQSNHDSTIARTLDDFVDHMLTAFDE
jgi:patatin-like phospholipase/acyl hydrolase